MIPNGSQVLVTLDIDAAYFVDLSSSTSPAAIKERIYAKLGIYDDDHANCRISRCRAGQPVGQPLDDWQLWDMCMRAAQDSDPPMLIVLSNNTLNPSSNHPAHRVRTSSIHNPSHSPNSPDSHSLLKHDHPSSSGSRDSDPIHHLSSRSRWHRTSRDPAQIPLSPHTRDGSNSSSSHQHHLTQATSSTDLRNQSSTPVFISTQPSPINPSFSDDRRLSPSSNTPFEVPNFPSSRRPPRPQIDPPDDWIRVQHPSRPSPESSSPTKSRHYRRPSDPPGKSLTPSTSQAPPLPSHSDIRFTAAEYARQVRSTASANPKSASSSTLSRRPPQSQPTGRRGDLHTAKSMEELHIRLPADSRKWAHPGVSYPPLPTDSALKIAASPASRNPPARLPARTDPSLQRPVVSGRPNHPGQTPPSFPVPQPTINPLVRPTRTAGSSVGYGSSNSNLSGSSGGIARIDPRTGAPPAARPPPAPTSSLSGRNPRVSLQIHENRSFDVGRPPPRPRTGDGTSPIRPSQFSDRHFQSLAAPSHIQQPLGQSSMSIRPGDLQHDLGASGRRREQSREYRTELEREPAQRRPNTHSPTAPISLRPTRLEDPPETHPRTVPIFGLERPIRRPATEAGLQNSSRARPFDKPSSLQDNFVKPLESLSSNLSPTIGVIPQDAYGGFESDRDRISHTKYEFERDFLSDQPDRVGPTKAQLSLTMPQSSTRYPSTTRSERRLVNGHARQVDEGTPRAQAVGEASPDALVAPLSQLGLNNIQAPHSASSQSDWHKEPSFTKPSRGRSATTASASTGTLTSFANSLVTNTSTATSATTPPAKANMFEDFEDDDDEVVGTFVTPMQPFDASMQKSESLSKPKLSLNTDTSNQPASRLPEIEFSALGNGHNMTPETHVPKPNSLSGTTLISPGQKTSNGHLSVKTEVDKKENRRVSFTGDDWAVRPPVDAVYENLEDFFPHHDLDKPIDIGVVPADLNSPSSPATNSLGSGLGSTSISGNINPTPSATAAARLKGRTRSIRVVAQEKKKLLRRTEDNARMASQQLGLNKPGSKSSGLDSIGLDSRGSALLRRKSTKLWGAKIEEVVPGGQVSIPSSINESAMDEDPNNFSFKWVKGELIGKGSFGQVYLALNATNGEMLAVKQVELPKTRSDRECERQKNVVNALKSEIHLMRDLEHPNIVQYLGFEETTVYLSIFLEYVPGGSIGRCLRRHGAFELNVIKSFTSQTLEGLKYLHSLHILHRDLKADNLLVDFSGNCKISDFGISKKSEHIYEDNTQMSLQGSIFWMAPEVVHNPGKKGYSAKVDIWSLGCVVLEMFAGRRPWSDEEAIQAMFKLGAERLRPPVPSDVKLGRMSDHFLAQCFIVDPDLRPTADRLTDHRFLEIDDKSWRFEDSELYRSIRMPH